MSTGTRDRGEWWLETLASGDSVLDLAEDERTPHKRTLEAAAVAQAYYLRGIGVQLDGIRRALVEHFHDCDSSLGGNEP